MLARLGWILVTDPVEAAWNDLHGLISVCVSLTGRIFGVRLYHCVFFILDDVISFSGVLVNEFSIIIIKHESLNRRSYSV